MYNILLIIIGIVALMIVGSIIDTVVKRSKYEFISEEHISFYIDRILALMKSEHIAGQEYKHVWITPINENGELYFPKADRIQFAVYCSEEGWWLEEGLKIINEKGDLFKIGRFRDSSRANYLIAETRHKFDCPNKKQMKLIYKMMVEEYPNLKLRFEGCIDFKNPFLLKK